MKSKIIKVFSLFIVFSIFLACFNTLGDAVAANPTLKLIYQSEDAIPFTTPQGGATKYRKATLDGEPAFCIDYARQLPKGATGTGTSMGYQGEMSAEALAVLVFGFPNNMSDIASFGISAGREEEVAYLATQMAFWEVVTRTGEMTNGVHFSIDDATPNAGYEDVFNEMKTAAKKLVDLAMSKPYNPNPRIVIDTSNYSIEQSGDKYIAGPYKVTGYDEYGNTDFTLHEIKATLKGAPSSAYVTDRNGNPKNTFGLNELVYVTAKRSDISANFSLNFDATGDLLKCGKYGISGSSTQNFATIIKEPITVSESTNITWKNDAGNISIIKQDQNNKKIAGVVFEVRNSSNDKVAEVTSDAKGRIDLVNLEAGKYYIKEISAPSGYEKDPSTRTVVIANGQTTSEVYDNTKADGTLEIYKTDTNGDPVPNVTFRIFDSAGKKLMDITTGRNGRAVASSLPIGTYTYREISAPDNIMIDSQLHKFVIKDNNQTVTESVVDELVKGSLKIVKSDENGEPISNVKFEIYDSSNKKVETIYTDINGIAITKELEPGNYYYQEIVTNANKNYVVDEEQKDFRIKSSGELVVKKVINYTKKGTLKILKVDQYFDPVPGVTFEIYDSSRNKIDTLVTDDKGIATSTRTYTLGKYYYKEVSAPDNIVMDPKEKSFEIKDADEVIELTEENVKIEGQLKLLKVDENNKPIEGATFEILDSGKNVVQTVTTDSNGVAVTQKLSNGTYYYREVSTPEIYILDSTEKEFVIDGSTTFVQETVINKLKSAKLVLYKLSKEDNTPIANARFEILDENKNVIANIVTNEKGIAETENLKVGTYYYKEVSVPDKYIMYTDEHEFKIKDDSVNIEKTVFNEAKKLPVTGSLFSTDVIIVIIISVSCIALYIIIKMIIAYIHNKKNSW